MITLTHIPSDCRVLFHRVGTKIDLAHARALEVSRAIVHEDGKIEIFDYRGNSLPAKNLTFQQQMRLTTLAERMH